MPRYSTLPGNKKKRVPKGKRQLALGVYAALILFFIFCIWWLRGMLLPFVIALLVAYILEPGVTRLQKLGIGRWLGVIVVYSVLVGAVALFLNYLVPVINNETGRFFEKFNVVLKEAPVMYEKLEGGVGEFLDRLTGARPRVVPGTLPEASPREEDWGFGPDLHRVPEISPPALSSVDMLDFGSEEEVVAEAGIPAQPPVTSIKLDGTRLDFTPGRERDSAVITIEQVKPGKYGVNLGSSTVEVRKTGEGVYTLAAGDRSLEGSRWADLREKVTAAMRTGLKDLSSSLLGGFFTFFQGLVSGIMEALVGLIVVFLVGAFAIIDGPRLIGWIRANVPAEYREHLNELLGRVDRGLSGVVRGQLIICLVNGVLSTIGFMIFIPEYAVVLGVLAGVMSLIPIFGAIISSIPAILIAVSISFSHALGVLAWILGIHFIEAYVLNPNIIGHQARIHPVLVVFVLIAGEFMYGVKGILLAVPVTSVVQSVVQFTYSRVKKYLT